MHQTYFFCPFWFCQYCIVKPDTKYLISFFTTKSKLLIVWALDQNLPLTSAGNQYWCSIDLGLDHRYYTTCWLRPTLPAGCSMLYSTKTSYFIQLSTYFNYCEKGKGLWDNIKNIIWSNSTKILITNWATG